MCRITDIRLIVSFLTEATNEPEARFDIVTPHSLQVIELEGAKSREWRKYYLCTVEKEVKALQRVDMKSGKAWNKNTRSSMPL